jgi:hypothetical protein
MNEYNTCHRYRRWPVASGCAGALLMLFATSIQAGLLQPTGCTSLQNVPVTTALNYGAAIQSGIFHNFTGDGTGCDACHTASGGPVIPGDLDLDAVDSPSPYANLVGKDSGEVPGMKYVEPNYPERSFLFIKLNCTDPGAFGPMPKGYPQLTPDQQALVYDWIAAGAPAGTTDAIFRGTFDWRGLVP